MHDVPEQGALHERKGAGYALEMKRAETMYLRLQNVHDELKPHITVDVSFWVAVTFTFGSAAWVINGFLVWFPYLYPSLETTAFTHTAAALAFIGGATFEVGSYLMVVEALDRGREIDFGTALGQLLHRRRKLQNSGDQPNEQPHSSECAQGRTSNTFTSEMNLRGPRDPNIKGKGNGGDGEKMQLPAGVKGFIWWGKPMWHDLGYLAAIIQLFAATIFWISTLTGLPGVIRGLYDEDGSVAIIDVFYWTPQVVGGSGFIISSLILMLEVQERWYIPKLNDIGWWVAVWNLVGAIGFTICGALGYSSSSGAEYQSALSTWWGSWSFLLGSLTQCCEVVWREPPTKEGEDQGEGKA